MTTTDADLPTETDSQEPALATDAHDEDADFPETMQEEALNDNAPMDAQVDDDGDAQLVASEPVTVPQPTAPSNIIRGLAESLPANGTLMLVIARLDEHAILVTIQPAVQSEEAATIPIQVTGSPDEIDANLVEALAHYVPARKLIITSAAEIAKASASAAQKQKDDAAKRAAASKPKPKTNFVTIKVAPKDAKLTVKDSAQKAISVAAGKRTALPLGKYTVLAEKAEFGTETATFTLTAAKVETVELTLQPSPLSFL